MSSCALESASTSKTKLRSPTSTFASSGRRGCWVSGAVLTISAALHEPEGSSCWRSNTRSTTYSESLYQGEGIATRGGLASGFEAASSARMPFRSMRANGVTQVRSRSADASSAFRNSSSAGIASTSSASAVTAAPIIWSDANAGSWYHWSVAAELGAMSAPSAGCVGTSSPAGATPRLSASSIDARPETVISGNCTGLPEFAARRLLIRLAFSSSSSSTAPGATSWPSTLTLVSLSTNCQANTPAMASAPTPTAIFSTCCSNGLIPLFCIVIVLRNQPPCP